MKLLFIIPEYSHGGTNKSLENLLALLDHTKYEVSIYCLYEDGGDYYKKLFAPFIIKKSRLYYWLHDNVFTRKFMGLYNKLTKRDNFTALYKREARLLQKKHKFDTVIAYQEGLATYFVSYMNNVGHKIAWIHCDYSDRALDLRIKESKIYKVLDDLVCVSYAARQSLCSLYPEFAFKAHWIYNMLDIEKIRAGAGQEVEEAFRSDSCFKIVSIGRLNSVKQFDLIPMIVNEMKGMSKGRFRWYIIGDGEEKLKIQREIEKYHLEEFICMMSAKNNPYPYIIQSDLLVCTSAIESFSYVIAEAKILHIPVLTNAFPVANEVVDNSTGWVAKIKEMPRLMARIIDDVDGEYSAKRSSIKGYEYSNDKALSRINQLFQKK